MWRGIVLLALASPAIADEVKLTKEQYTTGANTLADCAGLYEAFSEVMKATGNPASAEEMRQKSNGASMAAKYVLAMEYGETHKDQKRLGEFSPYVDGRAETTKTSVLGYMERNDKEKLDAQVQLCVDAQDIQNYFVQLMRDNMVGR